MVSCKQDDLNGCQLIRQTHWADRDAAVVCFCLLGSASAPLVALQPRRSEKQMVMKILVLRTQSTALEHLFYRLLLAAGPKAGRINAAFIGPARQGKAVLSVSVDRPDAQCNHSHE